jgi:hypothetical protein
MTTHDLESCFAELDTDGSGTKEGARCVTTLASANALADAGTISFNEYVEWISCARVPKVKVLPSN